MDGTMWIENEWIDGALEFLSECDRQGKRYVFLTNNSSRSNSAYVEKLRSRAFSHATSQHVFTSGEATILYLKEKKENCRIYLMGTASLRKEFEAAGLTVTDSLSPLPDFAVAAFDRELTYEKLEKMCFLLDHGVEFAATNLDKVCPIENGRFIPDCASMCEMLRAATGRTPKYIGKPEPDMIWTVCRKFQVPLDRTVMVGDRLYTDIAAGIAAGVTTVCVLSGESSLEDIQRSQTKPHVILPSIRQLYQQIKK